MTRISSEEYVTAFRASAIALDTPDRLDPIAPTRPMTNSGPSGAVATEHIIFRETPIENLQYRAR